MKVSRDDRLGRSSNIDDVIASLVDESIDNVASKTNPPLDFLAESWSSTLQSVGTSPFGQIPSAGLLDNL